MCLSIPARIITVEGDVARADVGGNLVECSLALVEGVEAGDYVLVHAGFAIQKYDEREAVQVLAMLREALGEDS